MISRRLPSLLLASLLAAPVAAERADLDPFLDRLQGYGFTTGRLRRVVGEIEVFFEEPREDAAARYDWVWNDLYLPETMRRPGTRQVRDDLDGSEAATLLHELAHAELDVLNGPEVQVHRDMVDQIQQDIAADPRHRLVSREAAGDLPVARFPRLKADEVSAYFLGHSLAQALRTIDELLLYNLEFPGRALDAGDQLVLPGASCPMPSLRRVPGRRFGRTSVRYLARFQGERIEWNEAGRDWVKQQLYLDGLGLSPPADARQLLEQLNRADTRWARGLRRHLAELRRRHIEREAAFAAPLGAFSPFGID